MVKVSHDPSQCREALARTVGPVVVDLETTGLRRWNQIVSAGLLIDGVAYVLFVRSSHVSIRNLSLPTFRAALQPLAREDLVVIAHNAVFDLGFLHREGIHVGGEIRDTLKILRLLDQDRGGERDGSSKRKPRRDLRATADSPILLDYRLKHVAGQLLGIRMPNFPGSIELAPYGIHATYLACDLAGTKNLHDVLWPRLTSGQRGYYQGLVAPLIPIMVEMSATGITGDRAFIYAETKRLESLMTTLSEQHGSRFGLRLGMTQPQMNQWLFTSLRLPVVKWRRQGRKRMPSLDSKTLDALQKISDDPRALGSLKLIQDYRQAASLLVRLRSLQKHIDAQTGRIYSSFDDRQSSGRLSSTNPNLQQLAKGKTICDEDFRSRDALRASDGFEFAVFDIAQADIRVLADAVERFPSTASDHQDAIRHQRFEQLSPAIMDYSKQMEAHENPKFIGHSSAGLDFDPVQPADLAIDFRQPADFYTTAATRFLGRPPANKVERNRYKAIILSIVNGLGAPSLAKTMDCSEEKARTFLADFEAAYPKVDNYKRLMYWQIAWTGQTTTFMGRTRTVTAHRWLVTEPRVEILVSYSHGDAYWVDVVPLRPGLRVLTTFVKRAWNAKTGKLIYDSERGRLTQRPYSLFAADELQYLLPFRNWGWRSIRRVRARGEEADYEGFDATARAAFNFICQGGTADISKLMMIRSQPLCAQFGARLLIQIHDELVFEVPKGRTDEFLTAMKTNLELPPVPGFAVPIVVEPKRGFTFGSLVKVEKP